MSRLFARALFAAVILVFAVSSVSADMAAATAGYAELLTRYVTPRGVRYDAWRASGADLKTLSEVVMLFRTTDPAPLSPTEREALYINLYNAKILETVLFANVKNSIKELSKAMRPMEVFDRGVKAAGAYRIRYVDERRVPNRAVKPSVAQGKSQAGALLAK